MRALLLATMLAAAGCGTTVADAGPSAAPTLAPSPAGAVSARVTLRIPYERAVTGTLQVPADEWLVMDVVFSEAMDKDATTALVERGVRDAHIGWSGDRTLLLKVGPGGTFVLDLSGARAISGGTVAAAPLRFVRAVTEISLYDVRDLVRGVTDARRTWRTLLFADHPVFAPDGETIAVLAPQRQSVFRLHLPSGLRHEIPIPNLHLYSRAEWTPDGSLVVTGSAVRVVGPTGSLRTVADVFSQMSSLSPSGRRVALWTYGTEKVSVVDLNDGTARALPGAYSVRACGDDGAVRLAWSPEERALAIGHCVIPPDAAPGATEETTTIVDPATGVVLRRIAGVAVSAWTGPNALWAILPPRPSKDPAKQRSAGISLLAADGAIRGTYPWGQPSPDGRHLALTEYTASATGTTSSAVLLDVATGARFPVRANAQVSGWTAAGDLVVVSSDERVGAGEGPFTAAPPLTVLFSVDTRRDNGEIVVWMHAPKGEGPVGFDVFGPDREAVGRVPVMGSGIFTETSCVTKVHSAKTEGVVIGALRASQSVLRDFIARPGAYSGRVAAGPGSGSRLVGFVDSGCRGTWVTP